MTVNPLHSLPESIRENIVLAVVPTTGSFRDWSKFDNNIAIGGNCYWNRWYDKWGVFTDKSTGVVECGDFSSIDFSNGISVFVSFSLSRLTGSNIQVLFGGSSNLYLDISSDKLRVFTADLTDQLILGTTILKRDSYYTAAFTYDGTKKLYLNGLEELNEGTTGTVSLTIVELLRATAGVGRYLNGGIYSAILCKGCSDPNDVETINNWQQDLKSPRFRWQGIDWPSPISPEPNLVGAWDCGFIDQLVCEDRSSNGNNGLVEGAVHPYISPIGRVGRFGGINNDINCGNVSTPIGDITVEALVYPFSGGEGGFGRIFDKSGSIGLYIANSNKSVNWRLSGVTGSDFTSNINAIIYHQWNHVLFTRKKSTGEVNMYINGKLDKTILGGVENIFNNLNDFHIGDSSVSNRAWDGSIKYVKVYCCELSEFEARQKYNEFAKIPTLIAPIEYAPESTSNEGGGRHIGISDTEFVCGDATGRWGVIRDSNIEGGRSIECSTLTGVDYLQSFQAYGTWEFNGYFSETTQTAFIFIAEDIGTTTTAYNGYFLLINGSERVSFHRIVNGVPSGALMATVDGYINSNEWYKFVITRNSNDEFYFYIKGGAFNDFTLIEADTGTNPIVDSTHQESRFICNHLGQNDRHGPVKTYAGVIPL